MGYLSRNANLKPGQNVGRAATAGFSRRAFPSGRSWMCSRWTMGSRTDARVKLAANLNALEEVWVMFP